MYDSRMLHNCNTDLNSDNEFSSEDVYVVNALIKFVSSNITTSFEEYYSLLVSQGNAIDIDLSNFNVMNFFQAPFCFEFTLNFMFSEKDYLVYEAFQAWVDARGHIKQELSEIDEFKSFFNSLVHQGIFTNDDLNSEVALEFDAGIDDNNLMLPSKTQDENIITNDGIIPKVAPGEIRYDTSNTKLGENIDASLMNFLVSDPGVRAYYDWDGPENPRSWKTTGLCKVLGIENDELKKLLATINPPVDTMINKTSNTSHTPSGTRSLFHGKTISIYNDKVAISGQYENSGVVYVYTKQAEQYALEHEVIVPGNFNEFLPIIELHESELFVSNPNDLDDQKIFVYDIETPNTLKVENFKIITPPMKSKLYGFASCMSIHENGNILAVGSPTQSITKEIAVDGYTNENVECPTGVVYIYKKNITTWEHFKTIIPSDIDDYIARGVSNGSELDLQFGYCVKAVDDFIIISSPRMYLDNKERRTGGVYIYEATDIDYIAKHTFSHDEVNMGTLNILTGDFNFGTTFAVTSNLNKFWIGHTIPNRGTFIGEYENINGEYKMKDSVSSYKISDNILNGYIEIGSDEQSVAFGSTDMLYLLD